MESMDSVVRGRKHTYEIKVRVRPPKPGVVEIDTFFEITATDEAENLVHSEIFRMKPEDRQSDLQFLVDNMKRNAEWDFNPP